MRTKRVLICLLFLLLSFFSLPFPEVSATSETRYFQYNTWYRNGLWAYALNTTALGALSRALTISTYDGNVIVDQFLGIRVWVRASAGNETEITSGTSVGIATGNNTGEFSASWSCPQTTLKTTDLILVKIYAEDANPPTLFKANFTTEQLGVTVLNSASWTIYYHMGRAYNSRTRLTTYTLYWGSTTYDSRVANFTYGEAGGPTTLNLYGAITQQWTINHLNAWTFTRSGGITQTFTIGHTRSFLFTRQSLITQTWTINKQLSTAFTRIGTVTQTFTVGFIKAMNFTRTGIINQTFTVNGKAVIGVFLNFYGSITQAFTVGSQRAWEFARTGIVNPVFTMNGAVSGLGNILNLFGSIVQTFAVLGFASFPELARNLMFLAPILLTPFLIMIVRRKRKS